VQLGESRGSRKSQQDHQAKDLSDYANFSGCVQVCLVGIDIRDGMHAEPVNCGLCVDAGSDINTVLKS
jgi:polyferredoxin